MTKKEKKVFAALSVRKLIALLAEEVKDTDTVKIETSKTDKNYFVVKINVE